MSVCVWAWVCSYASLAGFAASEGGGCKGSNVVLAAGGELLRVRVEVCLSACLVLAFAVTNLAITALRTVPAMPVESVYVGERRRWGEMGGGEGEGAACSLTRLPLLLCAPLVCQRRWYQQFPEASLLSKACAAPKPSPTPSPQTLKPS